MEDALLASPVAIVGAVLDERLPRGVLPAGHVAPVAVVASEVVVVPGPNGWDRAHEVGEPRHGEELPVPPARHAEIRAVDVGRVPHQEQQVGPQGGHVVPHGVRLDVHAGREAEGHVAAAALVGSRSEGEVLALGDGRLHGALQPVDAVLVQGVGLQAPDLEARDEVALRSRLGLDGLDGRRRLAREVEAIATLHLPTPQEEVGRVPVHVSDDRPNVLSED